MAENPTRPKFDATALQTVLGPGRAPRRYDRQGRVALVDEAARVLIGQQSEAGLFVGGALLAWLGNGGDLETDYLKVRGIAGSHRTASQLWTSSVGRQESESADTVVAPSSPESESKK